jgi:transposase
VVEVNSRRSQSAFACVACGYAANADVNAARVIVKRAECGLQGVCVHWHRTQICKMR